MAKPSGTRTTSRKSEEPTKLNQIELVCRITGKPFHTYNDPNSPVDPLPISMEGWAQLTDEQKYNINQKRQAGIPVETILNEVL